MIQVIATYKPGDRPVSIFATAEGCLAVCLRAVVRLILYCPLLLFLNSMRGRRRGHNAKNYSQLTIACGF
jgi:hypothetical protein